MRMSFKSLFSLALVLFVAGQVLAQLPEVPRTESSEPFFEKPIDDIVEKRIIQERRVLPYEPLREADILWEKRVWRVIDVREKMNAPFSYPGEYFVKIILDAAMNGEITAYDVPSDPGVSEFSYPLEPNEVASLAATVDTVISYDPETYEEEIKVVRNEINPEDIKKFRIKEVWYFDRKYSTLKVRILGIAPIIDKYDENDNFLFDRPMFWIYYPECRELFSRHRVFNAANDAALVSWEDLFAMRFFSSYIFKESNVYDRRLQDYVSGVDLLLEGEKIKAEIFNFEHDLWEY